MNSLYISIQRLRIAIKSISGVILLLIDAVFPKKLNLNISNHHRRKISEKNIKSLLDIIRPSVVTNDLLSDKKRYVEYLLPYQNPLVKNLVWQMKYHSDTLALRLCADIFYDEIIASLYESISSIPFNKKVLITSIPSSSFSRGDKSYDHMQEIMNILKKYFSNVSDEGFLGDFLSVQIDAIKCTSHGSNKSQHTGKRSERLKWSKDRFCISEDIIQMLQTITSDKNNVCTPYIICIDDVTTTGATFESVRQLLRKTLRDTIYKVDFMALSH